MPLLDHFHAPFSDRSSWDGFHAAWPTIMVIALNKRLPKRFVACPNIHLKSSFEIDISTFYEDGVAPRLDFAHAGENGGVATEIWAPSKPTLSVATDLPFMDEYEVLIYDEKRGRRLVAAVEIVSPSNKDRRENRDLFVGKCATLLQNHVCTSIIDLVTDRSFNLYHELLDLIGQEDPTLKLGDPPLYAVSCRWTSRAGKRVFEAWSNELTLGQPLPTLPLWIADDFAVPLDLESTYEETRKVLRLA